MKVLIVPDQGDHIYIKFLKKNLEKNGVDVYGIRFSLLSIPSFMLNSKEIDILHIHWQSPYIIGRNLFCTILKSIIFIFELLFLKLFGLKIVWTVHNLVNHEKIYWKTERFFARFLYMLSDKIIVHLFSQKKELLSFYSLRKDKIEVINQGNYIEISSNFNLENSREKLGIDKSKLIFLFFGQLREYKGVEFILESFKRVRREDALLYLVGKPYSNDYLKRIKKMIFDNNRVVLVPEYLNDYELYTYISSANCVLLTYKEIFNSAALIMAMSFKKSVIISDNENFKELVGDSYPLIVSHGDVESLSELFDSLDVNTLKDIGCMLYERVSAFSWDKHAEKLKEIYESLSRK